MDNVLWQPPVSCTSGVVYPPGLCYLSQGSGDMSCGVGVPFSEKYEAERTRHKEEGLARALEQNVGRKTRRLRDGRMVTPCEHFG